MSTLSTFYYARRNEAIEYVKQIPKDTGWQTLAQGAVLSVGLICLGDYPVSTALKIGSISMVATAVHGLVTPIFKKYMDQPILTWKQEMFRTTIALIGGHFYADAMGFHGLTLPPRFALLLNTFFNMFELRRNLEHSNAIWA